MFKFKQKDIEDNEDIECQPKSKYFISGSVLKKNGIYESNTDSIPSTSTSGQQDLCQNIKSGQQFNEKDIENNAEVVSKSINSSANQKPLILGNNTLLVNSNQSGNKLLKHLRIPYQMTDTISPAHYLMYDSCCAVFLSLKYHVIYPNYIYDKLNQLRNAYQLKVLLVLVDHIEFGSTLKELTKLSIRTNCTQILAWSYEEAANHIENYRNFADKSADIILGKQNTNSETNQTKYQCLIDALTSVKSINKTDAVSLISTFDSFENIVKSDDDQLIVCPGMAALKAQRLRQLFNKQFIRNN